MTILASCEMREAAAAAFARATNNRTNVTSALAAGDVVPAFAKPAERITDDNDELVACANRPVSLVKAARSALETTAAFAA